MFGTGKNIAKASIDFDELARLYLSQRYDESDTPDKFLVRFIKWLTDRKYQRYVYYIRQNQKAGRYQTDKCRRLHKAGGGNPVDADAIRTGKLNEISGFHASTD